MDEESTIELLPKDCLPLMEINIFRKECKSNEHFDIIDYQDLREN